MHDMTISEEQMLQSVREVFQGQARKISLRRALNKIYVNHALAEGRQQAERGQVISHEKVMEDIWNQSDLT